MVAETIIMALTQQAGVAVEHRLLEKRPHITAGVLEVMVAMELLQAFPARQ